MNWKLTVALIAVAAIVAVVAYINPFEQVEQREPPDPWFYQVSFEDIISIDVDAGENSETFSKNEKGEWVIDRLGDIPPAHVRWGGIVLLLSGPQTRRDFSTVRPVIEDPSEYGLDDPNLIVKIGLTADRNLEFRLGDETPDGDQHYGQVVGFPQLFLITSIWGEVLARLANEPPTPKWWQYRDPETIAEVNIYTGKVEGAQGNLVEGPYLRLQNKDGEWLARLFAATGGDEEGNRPLDAEKWQDYIPLMGGPGPLAVEEYKVRDRDYVDWGIDNEGRSVEIRFSGVTERGTKFTEGVLFLIGDKTPDGESYYALPAIESTLSPVLRLESEWADTLFDLVGNVPYGDG